MRGNNQLQCDTQLSDNSIPETASSRQSDVIKSRGYLIHVPMYVHADRTRLSRVCTRAKSTRVKSEFMDGRRGGWNRWFESRRIPNHQRWMCLCARGKRAGGEGFQNREIDSAWRVKCQSIWLFRSRCQTVKKNGGGMSNEFSRILVTRLRERNAYDLFPNFPGEGGIKSRIRSLICYPYPIFSFSSSTRLFETKFAIFNIVVSRQSISKQVPLHLSSFFLLDFSTKLVRIFV